MDCEDVCEALLQFIWSYLIRVTCGREAICEDNYFDLSIRHTEGKSFNIRYLMLVCLKHAFDIDTVHMPVYLDTILLHVLVIPSLATGFATGLYIE